VGIPVTRVQYPGLEGGGALGNALTPGTPAGPIAASAHGGTNIHIAEAGTACGEKKGAAAATAAVVLITLVQLPVYWDRP